MSSSPVADVLVLGSGSAALSAALKAAAGGLSVRVIEKSGLIGGTSAMSGAGTWVPLSRQAREAGIVDDAERVLSYIHAVAPPGWAETEAPLWRAFVAAAPEMLAFLEEASPLRFVLEDDADPGRGLPGALTAGRMVSPRPLRAALAGPFRRKIRPSTLPQVFTYGEMRALDVYHHPVRASLKLAPRILWRLLTGARTKGASLITGLMKGCLDRGVAIDLDTRAVSLVQDPASGRVTGVIVETDGTRTEIAARRGVVIATGGFDWDPVRRDRHFPGPFDYIASPRSNTGDGHTMAEAAGAALAHMDQGNLNPTVPTRYEGRLHGLGTFHHKEPNAILVDRFGRRFVDEYSPNVSEAIDSRDASGAPRFLPAWVITDSRLLWRAPILRLQMRHDPHWLVRAPTLQALADRIRLPADALAGTVARFNAFAVEGTDPEFGRSVAAGSLEAITKPPFIALPFNRSFLATKGGPRTDDHARVLRPDGSVIPGLYCAGVAMANPFGTRAYGSGTTIGPNLTWGYIAASTLLAEAAG